MAENRRIIRIEIDVDEDSDKRITDGNVGDFLHEIVRQYNNNGRTDGALEEGITYALDDDA